MAVDTMSFMMHTKLLLVLKVKILSIAMDTKPSCTVVALYGNNFKK